MKREDHLKVDKFVWNEEFNEVHEWLDSSFPKYVGRNPYMHWLEHHYIDSIQEKYGYFTPKFNVAYFHILMDYVSHFQMAYVPNTKDEAENMLKDLGVL